ncbi:nuclear transport factor 2 family protein [Solirubrum puertoriconensis]|nr:nuclear transport factor 2 family protein [Solirubrum puertoriconensis]
MLLPRLLLPAALLLAWTSSAQAQRPADAFVQAERDFARTAVEASVKVAFLGSIADSGIVFQNGQPALGKPVWQKQPEAPAGSPKLVWGPEFADAARSADLGYTTGPYYLEQPDGRRVAFGHYFTVWGRQADGSLKFLTDIGIPHAAPQQTGIPTEVTFGNTPSRPSKQRPADLLALDKQLSEAIRQNGMAPAYAAMLSQQSRLHRDGLMPLTTAAAMQEKLKAESAMQFQPLGSQISTAGDLGYVYGTYTSATPDGPKGGYAHVWKHEAKGWRLVAEVLNPTKPAKP